MAEEFVVIGKPELVDKQAKAVLTGLWDYPDDHRPPEKLYARLLLSPYAHARIVSIDTSAAEALEGVEAVTTHEDCPVMREEVLHWGEMVAAVAAVDKHIAEDALELIDVTYEELPFVVFPDDAMEPGAPLAGVLPDSNVSAPMVTLRGDVDAGFAAADVIVEDDVGWTAYFQHQPALTRTSVAMWVGDYLTAWTTSQNVFGQRGAVAGALGIPLNKVRIISHGTGVGHGDMHWAEWIVVAAVLAKKAGKPVSLNTSRREHLCNSTHQYGNKGHIKIGAKNDGTFTAIDATFWADVGGGPFTMLVGDTISPIKLTYRCPDAKFTGYGVVRNTPMAAYWRCVGEPSGCFLMEIVVDELAEELGMDPVELRLKNVVMPGEVDQDSGKPLSSVAMAECIQLAADAIGWADKWHAPGARTLPDGRKHGIGMNAFVCNKGRMSGPVGAVVYVTRDGKAQLLTGISRAGGGTSTAHAIIVAEELGLLFEDVMVIQGDTATCQDGGGQGGSTRTITTGAACYKAAEDAKQQLFEVAAGMLGVTPAELEAKEGKIYVIAAPENFKTHGEVAGAARDAIIGKGYSWNPVLIKPVGDFPVDTPCEVRTEVATFVEVAVDTETGDVEVLNIVCADDLGQAIFRKGSESQIEGGNVIGIGEAFTYEQIFDPETGATLNANFLEHSHPTTLDAPDPDKNVSIIVEPGDACGPFGCKGLGEPPVGTPHGAICNAVYNAIGVWIKEHPITPQKVLEALGKA